MGCATSRLLTTEHHSPYICSESLERPTDAIDVFLHIGPTDGFMSLILRNKTKHTLALLQDEDVRRRIYANPLKDIEYGGEIPGKDSQVHEHRRSIFVIPRVHLCRGGIRRIRLGFLHELWRFPPLERTKSTDTLVVPKWRTLSLKFVMIADKVGLFETEKLPKIRRKIIFRVPSAFCYPAIGPPDTQPDDEIATEHSADVPELPTESHQIQTPVPTSCDPQSIEPEQ